MNNVLHNFIPDPSRTGPLRRAFGRFGTGVTVVTVNTPDGPIGITANSFTSLSLDPALVMWAPALRSRRHDAFTTAEAFCIHVLGQDQLPLAQHFAAQGHVFENLSWSFTVNDVPLLAGCLATFECKTHAVHPAGDHSMVVGQVQTVQMREDDAPGLLFDRGRFGSFSPAD